MKIYNLNNISGLGYDFSPEDAYNAGYEQGAESGKADGYQPGYADGYAVAVAECQES